MKIVSSKPKINNNCLRCGRIASKGKCYCSICQKELDKIKGLFAK
jgi:hypothetical protein